MKYGRFRMILSVLLALALILGAAPTALAQEHAAPKAVKATGLKLNKTKATLDYGASGGVGSLQLKPTITPTSADANKDANLLEYTSSNPAVASVSKTGLIKPLKVGKAKITLKLLDGSGKKASCAVTVAKQKPTSVTLNVTGKTLAPGKTLQLEPTVKPTTAYNRDVKWKSTNKKVASVSKQGLVTAIKPGKASIICTTKSGGLQARAAITVGYDFKDVKYRFYGIVNTEYPDSVGSVPWYLEDAESLYDVYDGLETTSLVRIYKQQTGADMRSKISNFNRNISENDVSIFYYAGRASKSPLKSERGALMGVDGDYGKCLLTIEELQKTLDLIPGTIVLILDCDMSGQFIKSKDVSPKRMAYDSLMFNLDVVKQFSGSTAANYSAKAIGGEKKSKYKILAACGSKGSSYGKWDKEDEEGYAYFSHWLLRGLDEGLADKNKDGVITMNEAKKYVKAKVNTEVKKYNKKNKKKRSQAVTMWPSSDYTALYMGDYDADDE